MTRALRRFPAECVPSDRTIAILRFLVDAHPLPVATLTLAFHSFTTGAGALGSAERRAWRALNDMRKAGLVTAVVGPTPTGRSPNYWTPTKAGFETLVASGHLSNGGFAALTRTNKSAAVFIRRRHDHLCLEVAARVVELARVDARFRLVSLRHNESLAGDGVGVRPDLTALLDVRGEHALLLVEVQSELPPLKDVEAKLTAYRELFANPAAHPALAVRFVRLAFVTYSDDVRGDGVDHRDNVLEVLAEASGLERVARVATHHDVRRNGLAMPVFVRPLDFIRARETHGAVLAPARHKGNAVRAARDAVITEHVPRCRWFD